MVGSQGIQRKKCPYCGRTFKAHAFNDIVFESQEKAREYVQKMNYRYGK